MNHFRFIGMISVFVLSGCTMKSVAKMEPTPNIDVVGMNEQSLALDLTSGVQDTFEIKPAGDGCMGLNMTEWLTSLKTGFDRGFGKSFKIVNRPENAKFVIKVIEARPNLVATSVVVNSQTGAPLGAGSCGAQVNYRARLLVDGKEVKSSAKTAVSKRASGTVENSLKSGIESMYEVMAEEFFHSQN